MKLLTKKIKDALLAADMQVRETGECSNNVVVKLFNPCGASTWYIKSGTPVNAAGLPLDTHEGAADWHLFGLCDLHNDGGELGYVMLSELQGVRLPFGLTIERDTSFSGQIIDGKLAA